MDNDTIAAISTPPGEGAIGIVRLSGSASFAIARDLFRNTKKRSKTDYKDTRAYPIPGKLTRGYIVDEDENVIDEVLICFLPAPHTYTRENVVEINAHGGMFILSVILKLLIKKGARLANPGEFTRRAYLNGRIDLIQAGNVLAVIEAKSLEALKAYQRNLKGSLSEEITELKKELHAVLAEIEASLDFDRDDLDEEISPYRIIGERIGELASGMDRILERSKRGGIWRHGLQTVIAGRPNVGKSSLYNFLLGEDRAIVTEIPGTTRDLLTEFININGMTLKIMDTAGIHIKGELDPVERIGMSFSGQAIEKAGLILFVLDASAGITEEDVWIYNSYFAHKKETLLFLANKIDLPDKIDEQKFKGIFQEAVPIKMSALTGEGMGDVLMAIGEKSLQFSSDSHAEENIIILQIREEELLSRACNALHNALQAIEEATPPDLVTIDLGIAEETLGEMLGDVQKEDLLDEIFSRFCIGK